MDRNLRDLSKAHLFDSSAGVCDIGWQGDFGKGVATGSGTFSDPGINPWVLNGPVAAGSTSVMSSSAGYGSNAIPQIQQRLGMVVSGDYGTEWVFCRFSASGTPDLMPGMAFNVDENFTAVLTTTTTCAATPNAPVFVGYVFAPALATGVYYLWLCRAGNILAQAAASSVANGGAQSGATAGVLKFLISHTSATWSILPFAAYAASSNITFKADSVNGSPYLTNVSSQITNALTGAVGGITDLCPGMVFTGTGAPSNALIKTIDFKGTGGSPRITIGTNTAGAQNTEQNASATNTATTFTVTTHVQASLYWPTIANAVTP